jgi:hypothetical protein
MCAVVTIKIYFSGTKVTVPYGAPSYTYYLVAPSNVLFPLEALLFSLQFKLKSNRTQGEGCWLFTNVKLKQGDCVAVSGAYPTHLAGYGKMKTGHAGPHILRELIFWLFSPVVPQGFAFSCSQTGAFFAYQRGRFLNRYRFGTWFGLWNNQRVRDSKYLRSYGDMLDTTIHKQIT